MVSNGPPTRPRECNGARVTKPIENKSLAGELRAPKQIRHADDDDLESANVWVQDEPYD